MKTVATIFCVTGTVHTYMAAEAIKKECKKKGYTCKVRMQGAPGIKNKFSEKDIRTVDLTVFANDVRISRTERFDTYKDKIARHTSHQVIQKSDIIFETLK